VLSTAGPTIAGDPVTPLEHGASALALIGGSAIVSIGTLLVLHLRERRATGTLDAALAPTSTR
jgi:hypothetical protein